jgi:hypothetical protein
MKPGDLKKLLTQYPDGMAVVVVGYEGGYNDLGTVRKIHIMRDAHTQDYMGQHDDASDAAPDEKHALLLTGENLLSEGRDA